MISLEDPKWQQLEGGYRLPFDASVPLRQLETATDLRPIWDELWNELHHQGDVGEASYAAVPHLVRICRERNILDWNLYALTAAIESRRTATRNPPMPAWLAADYDRAWKEILELALSQIRESDDPLTTRSMLGSIALAKGLSELGTIISEFDESEIQEIHAELYGETGG